MFMSRAYEPLSVVLTVYVVVYDVVRSCHYRDRIDQQHVMCHARVGYRDDCTAVGVS